MTQTPNQREAADPILDWLAEAEAEWIAARDSSGYALASAWAMKHGRKLVFDYRRAVHDFRAQAAELEALRAQIAEMQSDHAETFSGKVVMSIEAFEEMRGAVAELCEGLRVFERHGRAMGAYGDDPGPIRYYTEDGYREVPAEDFRRAQTLLSKHLPREGREEEHGS